MVAVGLAARLNLVTSYLSDLKQQYGDARDWPWSRPCCNGWLSANRRPPSAGRAGSAPRNTDGSGPSARPLLAGAFMALAQVHCLLPHERRPAGCPSREVDLDAGGDGTSLVTGVEHPRLSEPVHPRSLVGER